MITLKVMLEKLVREIIRYLLPHEYIDDLEDNIFQEIFPFIINNGMFRDIHSQSDDYINYVYNNFFNAFVKNGKKELDFYNDFIKMLRNHGVDIDKKLNDIVDQFVFNIKQIKKTSGFKCHNQSKMDELFEEKLEESVKTKEIEKEKEMLEELDELELTEEEKQKKEEEKKAKKFIKTENGRKKHRTWKNQKIILTEVERQEIEEKEGKTISENETIVGSITCRVEELEIRIRNLRQEEIRDLEQVEAAVIAKIKEVEVLRTAIRIRIAEARAILTEIDNLDMELRRLLNTQIVSRGAKEEVKNTIAKLKRAKEELIRTIERIERIGVEIRQEPDAGGAEPDAGGKIIKQPTKLYVKKTIIPSKRTTPLNGINNPILSQMTDLKHTSIVNSKDITNKLNKNIYKHFNKK